MKQKTKINVFTYAMRYKHGNKKKVMKYLILSQKIERATLTERFAWFITLTFATDTGTSRLVKYSKLKD